VTIEILPDAQRDFIAGFRFYERQSVGLGRYFLDCLITDIEPLATHAGVHRVVFGYHRALARRFPFAIYYRVEGGVVRIRAVLDCRSQPSWIRRRISR
jgi:plasmid stabilization system protein ParE